MLTESLDSKNNLENKFIHKMSLNIWNVILTRYLPAINFGVNFPQNPPKRGFRWYDLFLDGIANKFTVGNLVNPVPN